MHIDAACIFISYNRDFIFISVLFKALSKLLNEMIKILPILYV